jgi:hypothetical protein
MEPDEIAARLRAWTEGNDPHVRAAVELLIGHGYWLRRPDFTEACVSGRGEGEAWIRWAKARDYAGTIAPNAGTHNLAVLDLAVAIGGNRYRLSTQNDEDARLMMIAFATALGMEVPRGA